MAGRYGGGVRTFADAFLAGYQAVESPDEVEARKTQNRLNKAKADVAEIESKEFATPEAAERRKQKGVLDLENVRSQISSRSAGTANEARRIALQEAEQPSILAAREAAASENRAQAKKLELANEKEVARRDRLQRNLESRRQGLGRSSSVGPQSALPLEGGQGSPQLTGSSAGDTLFTIAAGANPYDIGSNAVREGLMYAAEDQGIMQREGIPTVDTEAARMGWLRGEGAADIEDIERGKEAVRELVNDGDDKMSEAEENYLLLAVTYDDYIQQGEPEEAKKVAASLLQGYRKMFGQYAAVAQAAAQKGDVDGAVKAAVKAYANVPDGNDVAVTKKGDGYELTITDLDTGKQGVKQLLSPDEIMGKIMQINPGHFEGFISEAAGEKAKERSSPAYQAAMRGDPYDPGGLKPEEANTVRLWQGQNEATGGGSGTGGRRNAGGFDAENYAENLGSYGAYENGVVGGEASGLRGVFQKVAAEYGQDEGSGARDTTKPNAWDALSKDRVHRDSIENLAQHILAGGDTGKQRFTGSPETMFEFLINSSMDVTTPFPFTSEDIKRGTTTYKGAKIPLDSTTVSVLKGLYDRAKMEVVRDDRAAQEAARRTPQGNTSGVGGVLTGIGETIRSATPQAPAPRGVPQGPLLPTNRPGLTPDQVNPELTSRRQAAQEAYRRQQEEKLRRQPPMRRGGVLPVD